MPNNLTCEKKCRRIHFSQLLDKATQYCNFNLKLKMTA